MPTHSDLMECIRDIRAENIILRDALSLLLEECVQSGNAAATDYGWPKAIAAARAALNLTQ